MDEMSTKLRKTTKIIFYVVSTTLIEVPTFLIASPTKPANFITNGYLIERLVHLIPPLYELKHSAGI